MKTADLNFALKDFMRSQLRPLGYRGRKGYYGFVKDLSDSNGDIEFDASYANYSPWCHKLQFYASVRHEYIEKSIREILGTGPMVKFLSSCSIHITVGYFEKNVNFSYEIKTEDDLERCLAETVERILLMDSMCCKCSDIGYIADCLNEELATGLNYLGGDPLNRYYRMLLLNKLINSPQYTLALEYVTGLPFYPKNAVFKSIIDRIKDL